MLTLCRHLFDELNRQGLRYCHWKSNVRLTEATEGKTDLDLLVHDDDADAFVEVLRHFDIKQVLSPYEKRFDGIDDYLGFDDRPGTLIHLHVHYRLILGQRYLKNHHLPVEQVYFDHLTMNDGVSVPCPELELVVLIIRAHMKIDGVSLLKHAIKGLSDHRYTAFPADIEQEFDQLIGRIDEAKLRVVFDRLALPLQLDLFLDFITRFAARRLLWRDLLRFQQQLFLGLRDYKRSQKMRIYLVYMSRIFRYSRIGRPFVRTEKKRLIDEGRIVALVGADGSGKSTLAAELHRWLGWKLQVRSLYLGIPKKRWVEALSFLIRGTIKIGLSPIAHFFEDLLWLLVARCRFAVWRRSIVERSRRGVVLFDRFPLRSFFDMPEPMDGPRLGTRSISSAFSTWAARHERSDYEHLTPPDLVVVLRASVDCLRTRKTDIDMERHRMKADAVNAVPRADGVVLVDAEQPYAQVLLAVKRAVWNSL